MNKQEQVEAILAEIKSRKATRSDVIAEHFNLSIPQVAGILTTLRKQKRVVRNVEGWWALNHEDLNTSKNIQKQHELSTKDLANAMYAMVSLRKTI